VNIGTVASCKLRSPVSKFLPTHHSWSLPASADAT